jgi:hypothetical protein
MGYEYIQPYPMMYELKWRVVFPTKYEPKNAVMRCKNDRKREEKR